MSTSQLYLTHEDEGRLLTRSEYADAGIEAPWRYERVNGRLVVMTPAGYDHHSTVEPIRNHLGAYKLSHPEVIEHVFQESWAAIENDTDRLPDIAVYLVGGSGRIPGRVPDLVFEVVSESAEDRHRDYEEKREEYERIGVQEYVIVDRFEHRVTVLTLVEGQYQEAVLGPNDVYTSPLLPGLEIPLHEII